MASARVSRTGDRAEALSAQAEAWLRQPQARWALGVIGAVAEFEPQREAIAGAAHEVMTSTGAIRIGALAQARALAYELPSADPASWLQGIVLCLPEAEARGPGRNTVTELGPDREAVRTSDRSALLFDLGIGSPWCEVCIRTDDAALVSLMRAHVGMRILDASHSLLARIPELSPHRVFRSRLARIEVWQRIPRHGEASPRGAHTHFLPKLLRPMRAVQATVPVPRGWAACLSYFPPHPLRDALGRSRPFDRDAYEAFEELLEHYGDRNYLDAKRQALLGGAPETDAEADAGAGRVRIGAVRAPRIRRLASIVAERQRHLPGEARAAARH